MSANLQSIRCVSFSFGSLQVLPTQWLSNSDISVLSTASSVVTFDIRAKHGVEVHVFRAVNRWCLWKKTFPWSSKEELRPLSRVAYYFSVPSDIDRDQ